VLLRLQRKRLSCCYV